MGILELIEVYLAQITGSQWKNHVKSILDGYIKFLEGLDRLYYYQVLSSDKLDSQDIRDDLTNFMLSIGSAPTKRKNLKIIIDFWSSSFKKGLIPTNPISGVAEEQIALSEDERRLRLLKFIQGRQISIEDIIKELFVSERTIYKDIEALREGDGVWGHLGIQEIGTANGAVKFSSSIHPLVLAFNLTSLIELLVGISEVMDSNMPYKKPFESLYRQIWPQLTEYKAPRHIPRSEHRCQNFYATGAGTL